MEELKEIWVFEETSMTAAGDSRLVARLLLAQVADVALLGQMLRGVSVVQDDKSFTCRIWVQWAWEKVRTKEAGVLRREKGCVGWTWEDLEAFAREYVGRKVDGGKYRIGWVGRGREEGDVVPTVDVGTAEELAA